MQSVLLKGDVLSPSGVLNNHFLLFEDRVIKDISSKKPSVRKTKLFFDLKGLSILPGFIDLHLHGDPFLSAGYFSRFGTTAFLSTIPSVSKSGLLRKIEHIKDLVSKDRLPSKILGIHLEGPYINKKMAGAQDRDFIRSIDLKEMKLLIRESRGFIKIVSLAPELDNSAGLVRLLVKNNIIPSLAHTNATFKQAIKAINQGVIFSAHTFNRMGVLHHRAPGALGAVLTDDRVFCEAILDGLHINPALFKILLRCKGIEKVILSTDSIRFEDSINPDFAIAKSARRADRLNPIGFNLARRGNPKQISNPEGIDLPDTFKEGSNAKFGINECKKSKPYNRYPLPSAGR